MMSQKGSWRPIVEHDQLNDIISMNYKKKFGRGCYRMAHDCTLVLPPKVSASKLYLTAFNQLTTLHMTASDFLVG